MSLKKEALGKGIRALLEGIDSKPSSGKLESSQPASAGSVSHIPLDQIEVNPFQPRMNFDEASLKDLSDSIQVHGVIQPITVRKISAKKFQLISGERRVKASRMAGLDEIPAFIRTANDQEMLEIALIENTHREDLNAIEIAINYKRLLDECSLKQEELAARVGRDRATVANYLRLLKLPPDIQLALKKKEISMAHARAIISVEDPMLQLFIFKEIAKKGMSVRKVEEMVRDFSDRPTSTKSKSKSSASLSPELKKLQDKITSHLATRVRIHPKREGKGEITISYFSNDDMIRIIDLIEGN